MRETSLWFGKGGLGWRSSRAQEKEDQNAVYTIHKSKVGALFQLFPKKQGLWPLLLKQVQLAWLCGYKHVNYHRTHTADIVPMDVILQAVIGTI